MLHIRHVYHLPLPSPSRISGLFIPFRHLFLCFSLHFLLMLHIARLLSVSFRLAVDVAARAKNTLKTEDSRLFVALAYGSEPDELQWTTMSWSGCE